ENRRRVGAVRVDVRGEESYRAGVRQRRLVNGRIAEPALDAEVRGGANFKREHITGEYSTLPVRALLSIRHGRTRIVEKADRNRIGIQRTGRRAHQRVRVAHRVTKPSTAAELVPPLKVVARLDEQPGAEPLVEPEIQR